MKIFSFIKELFSKNVFKEEDLELPNVLLNINSIIPIPTREEVGDDYGKIDEFISSYKKTLNTDNTLTSVDVYSREIKEKMDMYTEILLMLVMGEDREILMEEMALDTNDHKKLNLTLSILKFKNYLLEIETLRQEVRCRLVALNEIVGELLSRKVELKEQIEEKKRNRIRNSNILRELVNEYKIVVEKINIINQGINHLSFTCLAVENQRTAIGLEVSRKLDEISVLDTELTEEETVPLVKEKLGKVVRLAQVFIPSELDKILISDLEDKLKIVLIESDLEKYAFSNKNQVETFKEEINNLDKLYADDKLDSEEILGKVKKLELKLKVFDYYGENLITRELLDKVYRLKFYLLVKCLLNGKNVSFIDERMNYAEMEYYDEIVMDKIEYLVKMFKPNNDFMSTYDCIEFLRNESNVFSVYEILSDPLLSKYLILFFYGCLDKEDAFYKLIKFKVKRYYFPEIDFCEDVFKWEDDVSLEAICLLIPISKVSSKKLITLSKFYHKIVELTNKPSQNVSLPEGLAEIDLSVGNLIDPSYGIDSYLRYYNAKESTINFLKAISKMLHYKNLELPSTLKRVCGDFCSHAELNDIYFNEGLERLECGAFKSVELTKFRIPSTLYYWDDDCVNYDGLFKIYFKNYENSRLLNGEMSREFEMLALRMFKLDEIEHRVEHVPEYIREKQRAYQEGRYSSFCDSDLFVHDEICVEYLVSGNNFTIFYESIDGHKYNGFLDSYNTHWFAESNKMFLDLRNREGFATDIRNAYFRILDRREDDGELYTFGEMVRIELLNEFEKRKKYWEEEEKKSHLLNK